MVSGRLPPGEETALGDSLPRWPVFPEVPGALAQLRDRGWKLVPLSNTDPDFLDASMQAIGVPFDGTVVAGEIGSYKPAHGHWKVFYERFGADPERHVQYTEAYAHYRELYFALKPLSRQEQPAALA